MRIITKNDLCKNRPYINLKKLPWDTSLRIGTPDEHGFKTTYIIDQNTGRLSKNENYSVHYDKGIEKITFDTDELHGMILAEINYSSRTGDPSAKFKLYLVLKGIKYALPFEDFKDIYEGCMDILRDELKGSDTLSYIEAGFKNLKPDDSHPGISLSLKRLSEFRSKVNYKRKGHYFVINNIESSISKFDINDERRSIKPGVRMHVLRYDSESRLYKKIRPSYGSDEIKLKRGDIICDMGDSSHHPVISLYTSYGLGKLLDIDNSVIPTDKLISLFANIMDLGLDVLC